MSLFQPLATLLGKLLPPNINTIKVKGEGKVIGSSSEKKYKKKITSYNNKSTKSKDPVITIKGKSNH